MQSSQPDQHSMEQQQTSQLIAELEDMALDPTLDQCCRRDIESHISKERIRHSLQQNDRVDARQRLAASAICRDARTMSAAVSRQQEGLLQHQLQQQQSQTQQQLDAADEDLERLRRERLQQLQAQAAVQQQQQRAGFGFLNNLQEQKLQTLLTEPLGRGMLVVHLAVQGFEPCNALDEILDAAAGQYRGTYFARVVVGRHSPLVAQLQLPHGAPALLVGRQGAVMGKAPLAAFGRGGDIWEEEVLAYLRRFKVLAVDGCSSSSRQQQSSSHRQQQSVLDSDADSATDDDVEADLAEDADLAGACEVCGRTYPHEHVRAVYSSNCQDSDSGDDV